MTALFNLFESPPGPNLDPDIEKIEIFQVRRADFLLIVKSNNLVVSRKCPSSCGNEGFLGFLEAAIDSGELDTP